ncbi:MAG: FRG domain-containing protein [Candidatus Hodarchaeota archaeon]
MDIKKLDWFRFDYHGLFPNRVLSQAWPIFPDVNTAIKVIANERVPISNYWRLQSIFIEKFDVPEWAKGRYYYRGQSDPSYSFAPTIFRNLPKDQGLIAEKRVLQHRLDQQKHFVKKIFNNPEILESLPGCKSWTYPQKLAAARHYGSNSEMLDFTADPEVAAFFAARLPKTSQQEIGVIYELDLSTLAIIPGMGGVMRTDEGFNILKNATFGIMELLFISADATGIKPMSISIKFGTKVPFLFSCIQVPEVSRISAQKGIFLQLKPYEEAHLVEYHVEASLLWHLLGFLSRKMCFYQTGKYTNSKSNITEHHLMPPDDPIQKLIGNESASHKSTPTATKTCIRARTDPARTDSTQ